jgi:hypothetical protein
MKGIKIPTEVYSRVVGYFRPVSQWNYGKQDEFSQRSELKFDSALSNNERCICNK